MNFKRILLIIIIVLVCIVFISAWPLLLISFATIWIVKSVKNKKQHLNFRLLISSALIVIALAEIVFRIVGKHQVYMESIRSPIHHILFTKYLSPYTPEESGWIHVHPPGFHNREVRTEYVHEAWQTNNEGLHDTIWHIAKTNKCRVIVIGDSFTEGDGSNDDSTYARQLAHDNDSLEVMNAGVSGSDPAFELKLLEMRLFKYHPDVIIMSINSSDIYDFEARGGLERFQSDSTCRFTSAPWWEPLYSNSFIVRSFVHDVCKLDYNLRSATDEKRAHSIALSRLDESIQTASVECRKQNIRFIANFHPVFREIIQDSMDCSPIIQKLQTQGVETFNMLHYFNSQGVDSANASQYYWHYDGHHNNKGYALMAKGLATLLH